MSAAGTLVTLYSILGVCCVHAISTCNHGNYRPLNGTGCKSYQECVFGLWSAQYNSCPNGLLFNVRTQTCDWTYNVDFQTCGSSSLPVNDNYCNHHGLVCHHGYCVEDLTTSNYACHCSTGYTGDTCQLRIVDHLECHYYGLQCVHGDCVSDSQYTNYGKHWCNCYHGYKGQHCESLVAFRQCNPSSTIASIINGVSANNANVTSCPSGSFATPEAFVLANCQLAQPSKWMQGIQVQHQCNAIPVYTPVATFNRNRYSSTGGLTGIFLGCLPDGFKLGVQQCDHLPTILHVVNGGLFTMDPDVYFTVQ